MNDSQPNSAKTTRKREGFLSVPREVLLRSDVSLSAKLVFASIRDLIHFLGPAFGIRRLCDELGGAGPKVVQRAIVELEEAKLLRVTRMGRLDGLRLERRNRYELMNGVESTTLNRDESTTLKRAENHKQGRFDHVDSVESTTLNRDESTTRRDYETKRDSSPPGEGTDSLTRDGVQLFVSTYERARGRKPDALTPKQLGQVKHAVHQLAGGSLDEFKRRLELAAGFNGQAPPWPFNKPGELNVGNIVARWDSLGDALNCEGKGNGQSPADRRRAAQRAREHPENLKL